MYNLLFRWFIGLGMDEPIWDHSTFSKNRDRLLKGDVATGFFDAVLTEARAQRLLSDEHFTVDGTLLEAWASHKTFQPKDGAAGPPDDPGNPTVNFRGNGGPIRRTSRRPTLRRSSIKRASAGLRSSRISATC